MSNSQSAKRRRVTPVTAPVKNKQSKLHQFFKTPAQKGDELLERLSQSAAMHYSQAEPTTFGKTLVGTRFTTEFKKQSKSGSSKTKMVQNGNIIGIREEQQTSNNDRTSLFFDDTSDLLLIPSEECGKNAHKSGSDDIVTLPSSPTTVKLCGNLKKDDFIGSPDTFDNNNNQYNANADESRTKFQPVDSSDIDTSDIFTLPCSAIIGRPGNVKHTTGWRPKHGNSQNNVPETKTKFQLVDSLDIDTCDILTLPCSAIIGKPLGNLKETSVVASNHCDGQGNHNGDTRKFTLIDSLEIDTNDFATLPCSPIIGRHWNANLKPELQSKGRSHKELLLPKPSNDKKTDGSKGTSSITTLCKDGNNLQQTTDFTSPRYSPIIGVSNGVKERNKGVVDKMFSLLDEAELTQSELESLPLSVVIAPMWAMAISQSDTNDLQNASPGKQTALPDSCADSRADSCADSNTESCRDSRTATAKTESKHSNIERIASSVSNVGTGSKNDYEVREITEPAIRLFEDSSNSSVEEDCAVPVEEKTEETGEVDHSVTQIDDTLLSVNDNAGTSDSNDSYDFSLSFVPNVMKGPGAVFIGS